jgi:hypothetical protein
MTVDTVNSMANGFLVASLIVGVISTYAIIASGRIKEEKLRLELSQAKVDSENAKATAAEANNKTALLNLKIEEETRKRVEAELALETLRAKLRSRSLTIKQREILLQSLSKLPETRITIISIGDKEAAEYAEQIISVLSEAGLLIIRSITGSMSFPQYGIIISPDPNISIVRDVFKKAEIDYKTGRIPGDPNQIGIFIGLKPPIDI